MRAKPVKPMPAHDIEKPKDPKVGVVSSLRKIMSAQHYQSIHEPHKLQLQTTNAYLQSSEDLTLPPQLCSERQSPPLQGQRGKSQTISTLTNQLPQDLYLKLGEHEHRIHSHCSEAFEDSLASAFECHQINEEKALAIKLVLLQKITKHNIKLQQLKEACIQEYSDLKSSRIWGKLTKSDTPRHDSIESDRIQKFRD